MTVKSKSPKIKENDRVRVRYTGSLKCGIIFDYVYEDKPLDFTLGVGGSIPGFENALLGMKEGENRTFSIKPEDGFGIHREDLIIKIDRSEVTFNAEPRLGMTFQIPSVNGKRIWVEITNMDDDTLEFDANHTLAGKELIYNVKLLKILSQE